MEEQDFEGKYVILVSTEDGSKEFIAKKNDAHLAKGVAKGLLKYLSPWGHLSVPLHILNLFLDFSKIKNLRAYSKDNNDNFVRFFKKAYGVDHAVHYIDYDDAISNLIFDFGNSPKECELFVQHPINIKRYIRPDIFNKTLSQEKNAAFRQIAATLGAKEITLISCEIIGKNKKAKGEAGLSEAAAQAGFSVELDENNIMKRNCYASFNPPKRKPYVPDDLKLWIERDADLKTMVRNRLEANVKKEIIKLEFSEHNSIGGEIAAKIASTGIFGFGVKKEVFHHSIWHFEVEYW